MTEFEKKPKVEPSEIKTPEVAERPSEVKIETEEDIIKLGEKRIEDTEKRAEEVIDSGKERLEEANKTIDLGPEKVEEVKTETNVEQKLQTVQEEIQELTSKTQNKIKKVTTVEKPPDEKAEALEYKSEELDFQKIQSRADQEIIEKLPLEENREITPEPEKEKIERMKRIKERLKEDLEKIPRFGKELKKKPDGTIDETQEITPDNLVFIHATDYSPKIKNGELKIPTLFDNTNGDALRTTVHFAVNHRVECHEWGCWDNKAYQIIIPAQKMLEKNGNPETLNPVDTFWCKSPTIPEGSIIIYEEGKKPDFPEDLVNKFHFIERKKDEPDDEVISLVLEKAGITNIKGGRKKVEEPNFEEPYKYWAEKKGLSTEDMHHLSWGDNLECAGIEMKKGNYELGYFYFKYSCKEILMNAPEEVKNAAIDKFYQVFKTKGEDLDKIKKELDACTYLRVGAKDIIYESPESFSRGIERAKARIENEFLRDIILDPEKTFKAGDKSFQLSEQERKRILQRMPKEAYDYLMSKTIFSSIKRRLKENLEKYGVKYE